LASKIDRVIDQLEETNRKIRELQFFLIRSGALSAINPVAGKVAGAVVAPAEAVNEQLANAYFSTLRETADILQTRNDNIPMLIESTSPRAAAKPVKKPRTTAQKKNDKMQSKAFKEANKALRTSKGVLRKGKTQADVAKRAQRELRKLKKKGTKTVRKGIKRIRRGLP